MLIKCFISSTFVIPKRFNEKPITETKIKEKLSLFTQFSNLQTKKIPPAKRVNTQAMENHPRYPIILPDRWEINQQ